MDNLDQILETLNFEGSNELVQFKRGNTQYHGDGAIKYKSFYCSKRAPKKKKQLYLMLKMEIARPK